MKKQVRECFFLFDFDGTLTKKAQLSAEFFKVVNFIRERSGMIGIVSGRSFGFGLVLKELIPLDLIIMETGGVSWVKKDNEWNFALHVDDNKILDLPNKVNWACENFSELVFAEDAVLRKTDKTFDIQDISVKKVQKIESLLHQKGFKTSRSNIHLHISAGSVDKFQTFAEIQRNYPDFFYNRELVFMGDSLNDETMFKNISHSVGVSNISKCMVELKNHPKVVLEGIENEEVGGVLNYLINSFE